jgi:hypothetical protein
MLLELSLIFGIILYKLIRSFFFNDDVLDVGTSDSTAIFSVAQRLEKLHGGKAYVGLRIPDADTSSRQNIDIVFLTDGEALVISVKNLSGFVSVNPDGSWSCTGGSSYKTETFPSPVVEAKKQIEILESYLEQRGVTLPEGFFTCKVVCPNPSFRTITADDFSSEVITYEQWKHMRVDTKNVFTGWIKGAFNGGKKKELQEPMHQNLSFILNSAPMWDRVEVRGNKYYLGEFVEFKGKHEDTDALKNIRRSKVSRMVVQQTSMLGFAPTRLQVLYCPRDIRNEGGTSLDSDWTEVTVRSSTELVFQPHNSNKVRKFKLSSLLSLSLSA